MRVCLLLLFALLLPIRVATIEAGEPEAVSLLGTPLYPPEISAENRARLEENLDIAKSNLAKDPDDPDALIWYGRRNAYLGRYREAIQIYTSAIEKHPGDPRLYRHRGHRYLTLRQIDQAIADLEKAARLSENRPDEVEPDGIPNSRNLPRSTIKTNIWYHLGLAHYLKQDFAKAETAYRECLKFAKNDDMLVATLHWLYMTLRRANKDSAASQLLKPIKKQMDVIENQDYYKLLLMYQKQIDPDSLLSSTSAGLSFATIGYGIGNWYLYSGNQDKTIHIFRKILQTPEWAAFGYLAAEAELSRASEWLPVDLKK